MTMMTQRHLLSSTMVLWGILFGWLSLISRTATACDCEPRTFNEEFDAAPFVDAVINFGRANIDDNGNFVSLMDEDDIANQDPTQDSYFLMKILVSYKGCAVAGSFEIIASDPVGAGCGISPEPGSYLLGTYRTVGFRRISLCLMTRPLDTVNPANWAYAESNRDTCP